jgi:tetratricopeptide (TPR) repeat protein
MILFGLQLNITGQLQHHASRHEIDSLKQQLSGSDIKDRIHLLNMLAGCYASLSFDTSFMYGNQALHLAETYSGSLDVALIKVNIGNAWYFKMNFKNAVLNYLSALRILEENKKWKELGEICLQLGHINFYIMRSDESISYYRKALKYYQLSGDEKSLASVWESISMAGSFIEYWPADSSLAYGFKMLNYSRKVRDSYMEAKALMEISMFLSTASLGSRTQKAIFYGDSALKLAEELQNDELISITYNTLGYFYGTREPHSEFTGDLILSRSNFEKSYHVAQKAGKNILQAMSLNNLAEIDIQEKRFDQAQIILDSVEASLNDYFRFDWKSTFIPDSLDTFRDEPFNFFLAQRERNLLYNRCYKLAMAKGELRKAIGYQYLYYQSRDSMNSAQQGRQLEMLMAEAEAERTDQKIRTLARDNELNQLRLSQARFRFIAAGAGVVIISLFLLLYFQRKRWMAEQKSISLEQKLLRSQMNPHFIFNSLASIQNFIVNQKANEASIYLSRFSQLVRNILDNSIEEYVPVQKEVETIQHYLELQQVRYAGQFTYKLMVDEKIDEESMMIPPMLAQPFIENAIEHGIRYKETTGHIDIRFRLEDNLIRFEVEDDGVGREKSREIELKQKQGHRSLSTSITHDRLTKLNKKLKTKIHLEITDLKNDLGEACGTRVSFGIPVVER